jgi:hypothetical protein
VVDRLRQPMELRRLHSSSGVGFAAEKIQIKAARQTEMSCAGRFVQGRILVGRAFDLILAGTMLKERRGTKLWRCRSGKK